MSVDKANKKADLNDEEMGLGANQEKIDINDVQITNEKKNEHRKAPPRPDANMETDKVTQPLLDSEKDKTKTGSGRHEGADVPPGDHTGIDDGLLEPENHGEDKKDGSELTHDLDSHLHHETHDDGVNTEDDGYMANGIHNRFGEDRPGSPMVVSIPDVNTYQQKKNLAQGMMDLALLSANANQLRYVLESSTSHPYYFPSLVFITCSIILQIGVGIGLIINSRYNVKDEKDICKADKINNMTVLGIFLITIVNVFITSFSVASPTSTSSQSG